MVSGRGYGGVDDEHLDSIHIVAHGFAGKEYSRAHRKHDGVVHVFERKLRSDVVGGDWGIVFYQHCES